MKICLLHSQSEGKTKLAAFDNALYKIGLHDYNLITLSSVIPPKSEIIKKDSFINEKKIIGNRLYVVMSTISTDIPYESITAGLGWAVRDNDDSGIFVEIEGHLPEKTYNEIQATLKHMLTYRKGQYVSNIQTETATCIKDPICAIVVAVYQEEKW